jgi:hypothetical protein
MNSFSSTKGLLVATLESLNSLANDFEMEPTLFFTENDLVSRAYQLIQEGIGQFKVKGKDGQSHFLVHHEYPTPFRCDMGGSRFSIKGDEDRTLHGTKYKRGHYDLVVFNPLSLQNCDYALAKGQRYEEAKSKIPELIDVLEEPPILLAAEFMFSRDGFPSIDTVKGWWRGVLQDYRKLEASRTWKGRWFIQEIVVLAFDITGADSQDEHIRGLIKDGKIRHCVPLKGVSEDNA